MPMAAGSAHHGGDARAATRATHQAQRPGRFSTMSLWNRFWYHLKVKPVNTVRLLLSLKLNSDEHGDGHIQKAEHQHQIRVLQRTKTRLFHLHDHRLHTVLVVGRC